MRSKRGETRNGVEHQRPGTHPEQDDCQPGREGASTQTDTSQITFKTANVDVQRAPNLQHLRAEIHQLREIVKRKPAEATCEHKLMLLRCVRKKRPSLSRMSILFARPPPPSSMLRLSRGRCLNIDGRFFTSAKRTQDQHRSNIELGGRGGEASHIRMRWAFFSHTPAVQNKQNASISTNARDQQCFGFGLAGRQMGSAAHQETHV